MPTHTPNCLPYSLSICGVSELPTAVERFRPTHVISIIDPDDEPLDFPASMTVLRLAFWDVHAMTGMVARKLSAQDRDAYPSIDHAQAILNFGRLLTQRARVLIHCWAGVSRSTAAAYLLICRHMPGDEHNALELVKAIRPQAKPNRLIVKFGDQLLGADRRMLRCVDR